MNDAFGAWDPEEALERWEKINAEQAEENRLKEALKQRDALQYSDKLAQEICERISAGELLINICELDHLPTLRRCNQWLRDDSAFNQLYKSALDDRLSIFEEQVIQIADDMKRDFKTVIKNGREQRVADPEMVARAKLRIEVRFRHLKAGRPSKWGDVSTLVTKSADDDFSNMSDAELERHIAEMEAKDRVIKAKVA